MNPIQRELDRLESLWERWVQLQQAQWETEEELIVAQLFERQIASALANEIAQEIDAYNRSFAGRIAHLKWVINLYFHPNRLKRCSGCGRRWGVKYSSRSCSSSHCIPF